MNEVDENDVWHTWASKVYVVLSHRRSWFVRHSCLSLGNGFVNISEPTVHLMILL